MQLMKIDEIQQMAVAVCKSGLFAMPSPDAALTLMLLCQSEGLHPIAALKRYHIIKGRPAMRADAMLAEFLRQAGKVEWQERSDARVAAVFSTEQSGSCLFEWTLKQAEAAGLMGNPTWQKFPRQMLTARVISEAVRTMMPGVVCGVYTPEEVADFDAKPALKSIENVIPEPVTENATVPTETLANRVLKNPSEPEFVPDEKPSEPKPEIEAAARPKSAVAVANELKDLRALAVKSGCKSAEEIKALYEAIVGHSLAAATSLTDAERQQVRAGIESLIAERGI